MHKMPHFRVKNAFFFRGLHPLDPDQGAASLNHRPPWTPRPHKCSRKTAPPAVFLRCASLWFFYKNALVKSCDGPTRTNNSEQSAFLFLF
jgi:hypothetical protein